MAKALLKSFWTTWHIIIRSEEHYSWISSENWRVAKSFSDCPNFRQLLYLSLNFSFTSSLYSDQAQTPPSPQPGNLISQCWNLYHLIRILWYLFDFKNWSKLVCSSKEFVWSAGCEPDLFIQRFQLFYRHTWWCGILCGALLPKPWGSAEGGENCEKKYYGVYHEIEGSIIKNLEFLAKASKWKNWFSDEIFRNLIRLGSQRKWIFIAPARYTLLLEQCPHSRVWKFDGSN